MADSYLVRPKKQPKNKTEQKNNWILGLMWLGILPDLPLVLPDMSGLSTLLVYVASFIIIMPVKLSLKVPHFNKSTWLMSILVYGTKSRLSLYEDFKCLLQVAFSLQV